MPTPPHVVQYLTTDYLYHWICSTCGSVSHYRPGATPESCTCGSGCWKALIVTPENPQPHYIQRLAMDCAVCRRTLAKLNSLTAQMELLTAAS